MKFKRNILYAGVALLTAAAIAASVISLIKNKPLFLPDLAEEMDRQVNYHFKDELNVSIGNGKGYQFGDKKHTISYGFGKKDFDSSLSPLGKVINNFLNKIQPWHGRIIVKHEDGKCDSLCTRPYVDHF